MEDNLEKDPITLGRGCSEHTGRKLCGVEIRKLVMQDKKR
jgi:hypothetical protein